MVFSIAVETIGVGDTPTPLTFKQPQVVDIRYYDYYYYEPKFTKVQKEYKVHCCCLYVKYAIVLLYLGGVFVYLRLRETILHRKIKALIYFCAASQNKKRHYLI